jgi:hypothetical protein
MFAGVGSPPPTEGCAAVGGNRYYRSHILKKFDPKTALVFIDVCTNEKLLLEVSISISLTIAPLEAAGRSVTFHRGMLHGLTVHLPGVSGFPVPTSGSMFCGQKFPPIITAWGWIGPKTR